MPLSLPTTTRRSLPLLALFTHAALHAQTAPPLPLWEVGGVGFGVSQQAYPGADQQVQRALALPYVIYRGRYLRADSETAGLRAVKTPRYELDVGVAGSFGSSSNGIEARFFTMLTTIGTPLDVTAEELSIEAYFPADDATRALMKRLGPS